MAGALQQNGYKCLLFFKRDKSLKKKKATAGLLKEFDDNVYSNRIYNRTSKEYESRTPLLNRGEETFCLIYGFYNT